jgi:hypothetical protein
MTEQPMPKQQGKPTVSLPVRLTTGLQASQPVLSNHAVATVSQGLAYLDFGFVEPTLMAARRQSLHQDKALPKRLEGKLTTRVVLPLEALLSLQQQLAQVVVGLQRKLVVRS